MSKIVVAANVMINNKDNISNVRHVTSFGATEYYFIYEEKYIWSMTYNNEVYSLYYYKTDLNLNELITANEHPNEMQGFNVIRYSSDEIGTKEALSTFRELYQVLKEKELDIDKILDDIIKNEEVPF